VYRVLEITNTKYPSANLKFGGQCIYVYVGGICISRVGNNKYKISFGKFQVWRAYMSGDNVEINL